MEGSPDFYHGLALAKGEYIVLVLQLLYQESESFKAWKNMQSGPFL